MIKQLSYLGIIILSAAGLSFTAVNGKYVADLKSSELRWTGYHLAKSYEHNGFVQLKSGSFTYTDGVIQTGEFIIDMNTITNTDLKDEKDNTKLVKHLKSDDFFDVKNHPEAKLVIRKSVASKPGVLKTTADLTIRGITKTIEFDTFIKETGDQLVATADLNIQRTDFKVMYGWKLENAMLSGEFRLQVKIVANAKAS